MPWTKPRNVENRACRMRQMIDRLEVDKGALVRAQDGETVAIAFQRCQDCKTLDECLPWLEGSGTSGDRPDFCPNAPTFAEFRSR